MRSNTDSTVNMTTQHKHTQQSKQAACTLFMQNYAFWVTKTSPNQLRKLFASLWMKAILPPHVLCKWKPNFPSYHTTLLRSMYPLFLLGSKSHSALYPQLSCHYDGTLWFFQRRDLILAELHFLVNAVPNDCFRTSHKVLNRSLITKDKPLFLDLVIEVLKNSVVIREVTLL